MYHNAKQTFHGVFQIIEYPYVSVQYCHNCSNTMRGSRKLCQRGFDDFFFIVEAVMNEGREERGFKYCYKQASISPSAKRHLNGVSLAGQWWPNIEFWLGSFMVVQGIRNSITKKPYIFVIFQWGDPLPPPSGSAHEYRLMAGHSNNNTNIRHLHSWLFNSYT